MHIEYWKCDLCDEVISNHEHMSETYVKTNATRDYCKKCSEKMWGEEWWLEE